MWNAPTVFDDHKITALLKCRSRSSSMTPGIATWTSACRRSDGSLRLGPPARPTRSVAAPRGTSRPATPQMRFPTAGRIAELVLSTALTGSIRIITRHKDLNDRSNSCGYDCHRFQNGKQPVLLSVEVDNPTMNIQWIIASLSRKNKGRLAARVTSARSDSSAK